MAKTEVTIKLGPDQYRFMRIELEQIQSQLNREYRENVVNWPEDSPDKRAFRLRMVNLSDLLEEL